VDTGQLMYWEPGTELKEQRLYGHVQKPLKRLAQRAIYPALVGLLDRKRPGFDMSYVPQAIPPDVQQSCAVEQLGDPAGKP
jgi:hypothetical protein